MMRLIVVALLLWSSVAFAAPPPELALTPSERLEKLQEATGLSKETLELLGKEQPQLFGPLEKYLHHLKLFDLLSQGRDWEAAQHAITPAVESFIDTALKAVYPENFLTFVKAVQVYHGILQYVRDSFFVPHIENAIYERYKASREQGTDERMAFAQATVTEYFPAKPKMFDDYLKARGIQKEQLTQKESNHYWFQIDDFWRIRLETHYQTEQFQQNEVTIDLAVHKKFIPAIEAIQKAAGGDALFHAGLFLSLPGDLPPGWWVVKGWHAEGEKAPQRGADTGVGPQWIQSFTISRGVGYQVHPKSNRYYREMGAKERRFDLPQARVGVWMMPRFAQQEAGAYDWGKASITSSIDEGKCEPLGKSRAACLSTNNDSADVSFIRGNLYVTIGVRYVRNDKDLAKYAELAKQLARKVAAKIPATAN